MKKRTRYTFVPFSYSHLVCSPSLLYTISFFLSSDLRLIALLLSLVRESLDFIMSKSFSTADVAAHNKASDLYLVVDEDVYDVTKFQDEHPGKISSRALD